MRSSSIILLSGGLDSLVSFYWAREESDIMLGLTLNYGQLAAPQEIKTAAQICAKFDIPHRVVDLPWYSAIKSNPLTDGTLPLPQLNAAELNNLSVTERSAKAVWVPNRNGVFINVAASIAEDLLANWIVVGFNKEEAQTFPDNSESFVKAINQSLNYSTRTKMEVKAPMAGYTKTEIVRWGIKHQVDFTHLWSCYRGERRMCGACESCLRTKRAFKEANITQWLEKAF